MASWFCRRTMQPAQRVSADCSWGRRAQCICCDAAKEKW